MTSAIPPFAIIPPSPTSPSSGIFPDLIQKTVDELRLEVLRKHKKEILEKVRFSDVSKTLIACGIISQIECFEICKLSAALQMHKCFQKVHDIMDILVYQKLITANAPPSSFSTDKYPKKDLQNELVKDMWNNFMAALRQEHSNISSKMENDLDKQTESKLKRKNSGKLKKGDIGPPTSFQHVQHFALIRTKSLDVNVSMNVQEEGGKKKTDMKSKSPPLVDLDESDPYLQEFFKRAHVMPRHLTNPVTRQIIIKFIQENGGMDAVRQEVRIPLKSALSESNLVKSLGKQEKSATSAHAHSFSEIQGMQQIPRKLSPPPYAPANVPFMPTPKPAPSVDLYNF